MHKKLKLKEVDLTKLTQLDKSFAFNLEYLLDLGSIKSKLFFKIK